MKALKIYHKELNDSLPEFLQWNPVKCLLVKSNYALSQNTKLLQVLHEQIM